MTIDEPYDPHEKPEMPPPGHCGRLDDHMPHEYIRDDLRDDCIGGPAAAPGQVGKQAADDSAAIELLARQWRDQHEQDARAGMRAFFDDSYRFARDALDKLKAAGVEMVVPSKRDGDAET